MFSLCGRDLPLQLKAVVGADAEGGVWMQGRASGWSNGWTNRGLRSIKVSIVSHSRLRVSARGLRRLKGRHQGMGSGSRRKER